MRTEVRQSSIDVYHSLQSKFGAQTCKIMAFMNENPQHGFTRREIAKYLSIETSSVAGRVNELVKNGELVEFQLSANALLLALLLFVYGCQYLRAICFRK